MSEILQERTETPSPKTYEKVIQYVKTKILAGEYQLGQKLPPERELAQILDVSRNSVREALRTLEIMGVLESLQGAGNYVSSNFEKNLVESMSMMFILEKMDYSQLSELRAAIEEKALELAIARRTPDFAERLQSLIEALRESSDENQSVLLDTQLHYAIAFHSQNKLIISILQALSDLMEIFIADMRKKIMSGEREKGNLQQVHERLVEHIISGDLEGARSALRMHFTIIDQAIAKEISSETNHMMKYPQQKL